MKTTWLIITILGTAIISAAQEPKTDKTFQQKKFNIEATTDTDEYFAISPKFKTDTSEIKIQPFQKLQGDLFSQNNQSKNDFFANGQRPEFRMPVAGGGVHNYFNMPVAVPDSTVKYYIKEKRIESVNPLGKKYK
jgi:hypothetical protein